MTKVKNKFARFYALLAKLGMTDDERRDFVFDYTDGLTDSLKELYNTHPLLYFKMLNDMEQMLKKQNTELDALRKRVIASIGGWFKLIGQKSNIDIIKGTACRSTGYKHFNSIPKHRLQNVYSTFLHKQKDFKAMNSEMQQQLASLTNLN